MASPREALEYFAKMIEGRGGIVIEDDGRALAIGDGDSDWYALGEAYIIACDALGRKPMSRNE